VIGFCMSNPNWWIWWLYFISFVFVLASVAGAPWFTTSQSGVTVAVALTVVTTSSGGATLTSPIFDPQSCDAIGKASVATLSVACFCLMWACIFQFKRARGNDLEKYRQWILKQSYVALPCIIFPIAFFGGWCFHDANSSYGITMNLDASFALSIIAVVFIGLATYWNYTHLAGGVQLNQLEQRNHKENQQEQQQLDVTPEGTG